jgi:hypothetical protein
MFTSLKRLMVVLTTIAALLIGAMAPVAAQDAEVVDVEAEEVADRDIEKLRLRCRGRINAEGTPGVHCVWTRPTVETAALLTLQRRGADDTGWSTVYESENLSDRRTFDGTGEPGVRYRYRVVVTDAAGENVARSRSNAAHVPNPQWDILQMRCTALIIDGENQASCEWTASDEATSYELWRIVNRNSRELVGTYGADELQAIDTDLADDTVLVRYAVLGLDDEDEMVARSRVRRVRFPVADAA